MHFLALVVVDHTLVACINIVIDLCSVHGSFLRRSECGEEGESDRLLFLTKLVTADFGRIVRSFVAHKVDAFGLTEVARIVVV